MTAASDRTGRHVAHLRQIVIWPVYLLPLNEDAPIQDHWEHLAKPSPDNPWFAIDDEFGDPEEFQQRHYNEFVTFLPPVQRFLYGQGLGESVHRVYGESPIKVMRRRDIAAARVTLERDGPAYELKVAHVDLYFFFDIDIAILAVELAANDLPLEVAQDVLFRFGRAYPAYWDDDMRGGQCPWKVEWLSAEGVVLAASDFEEREKFLSFVCRHRVTCAAAHWDFLMRPLVHHHSDRKGLIRFRQLEASRMPFMAYLATDNPTAMSRADLIRLTLAIGPGDDAQLPYADSYLADFEKRYCYDRYLTAHQVGARFTTTGNAQITIGSANDPFFADAEGGVLARFRHQHFLVFLTAHFQKSALRMFSDRLVGAVSRLDLNDEAANRVFRRTIRFTLENFLRFAHRYWFHEISNQRQARELFKMTREHLDLDGLYAEVREELQDMGNFLEVEAARRQNESMVRLTVVTTFGLIGTVTTGFIGMNIFAWSEEPSLWRFLVFLAVFIPTMLLTLYTVLKSRKLSDFFDKLSDETATVRERWLSLINVWRKR